MFEDFYGLTASPFRLTPDQRFFYGSQGHRKALSYLKYGIFQGEGFIVITGDVGTGKSMLVSQLMAELDDNEIIAAQIGATRIDPENAICLIIRAFDIPVDGDSKAASLAAFQKFLTDQHKAGRRVLLVVDEAQSLPHSTLEELRMLSNFHLKGENLFQCFLIGQHQFMSILANPDLTQLQQDVIASYQLEPMTLAETREYMTHRMQLAGWTGNPEITDTAIHAIFAETGGVPRKINTLANRVLLHGLLEQLTRIDASHIADVLEDICNELHATRGRRIGGHTPDTALKDRAAAKQEVLDELFPASKETGIPGEGVPNNIMNRLEKIEATLLEHDRALRELIDTTVGYLSEMPFTKPRETEADAEPPSNVSPLDIKRTAS